MRLIDADELINKLNKFESDVYGSAECYSSVTEITEAIEYVGILFDDTPTVEAVPVVYGTWINTDYYDEWECDNCGYLICGYDDEPSKGEMKFCNMCGADMRKKV